MKITRAGITGSFGDYAVNLLSFGLLRLVLALPYAARVRSMGWLVARVVAPLAGWDKRVRANLAHVLPDLPEAEVRRLMREVPRNAGRALIEIYSGQEFVDRIKDTPFEGPGAEALADARAKGARAVLTTAHLGNYDVTRGALHAHGVALGSLYAKMRNPFFNRHYETAIGIIGQPLFPTGRRGVASMVRHLKDGGMIGYNSDVHVGSGARLDFFGKPAPTALSAAEMALKYDATLFPIYAIRQADGLSFKIWVDTPVPHSTPDVMMQTVTHSIETMVRQNMDQWFWIHRRWKPARQIALDAQKADAPSAGASPE